MSIPHNISNNTPNNIPDVGYAGCVFGKHSTLKEAQIVVIPMPYALTVSDRAGTDQAPQAILAASSYIDYGLWGIQAPWDMSSYALPILWRYDYLAPQALSGYYEALAQGQGAENFDSLLMRGQAQHALMVRFVRARTHALLQEGKIPALLGGEHSVSLGAIQALAAQIPQLGVLQIDAHMDLHQTFAAMDHAHACIMHQVIQSTQVSLTQVGIRAFAPNEQAFAQANAPRIHTFYQEQLDQATFVNTPWQDTCQAIMDTLPQHVYISVDIDGLALSNGLSTGTPVPNGLSLGAFYHLLRELVKGGRQIVGFDLVEVVPSACGTAERVAAAILYHLSAWAACSAGHLKRSD